MINTIYIYTAERKRDDMQFICMCNRPWKRQKRDEIT